MTNFSSFAMPRPLTAAIVVVVVVMVVRPFEFGNGDAKRHERGCHCATCLRPKEAERSINY